MCTEELYLALSLTGIWVKINRISTQTHPVIQHAAHPVMRKREEADEAHALKQTTFLSPRWIPPRSDGRYRNVFSLIIQQNPKNNVNVEHCLNGDILIPGNLVA